MLVYSSGPNPPPLARIAMTELERDMKERIERLTREIEARNAACKQYAYDVACLTDKVRALQVKMSLMSRPPGGIKFRAGG